MKKISPRVLLIVALTLSILCGMMIYSFLQKNDKEVADKTPVVVAAMDIAPGTEMTAEMVRLEMMPKELVQPGAMHVVKDAVGKRLRMGVNSGDQITSKRLNAVGNASSFVGTIPNDKRAVTINVDDVSGVAGFITPGCNIDILTVEGDGKNAASVGKLLLQDVLVLAVGSTDMTSDNGKKVENAKTITLALDPREAVELRVAQQEGKITMALRPAKPTDKTYVGATVYGKKQVQNTAPAQAPSYTPAPSASAPSAPSGGYNDSGITVIRGTNIGR